MTSPTPVTPTPLPAPTAVVTGASRGLGLALTDHLSSTAWHVVVDARHAGDLHDAVAGLSRPDRVTAVPGDVTDPAHRRALAAAVAGGPDEAGGVDLIVANASLLGPSPQPRLADYPLAAFESVLRANTVAPLALVQELLPHTRVGARILLISSDAAVEAMDGWGGYGASKAALEHLGAVLAVELAATHPSARVYVLDPGDMRTAMHQEAFPGEDISDRPAPESVVPQLRSLIVGERPSGRYRAAELSADPVVDPAPEAGTHVAAERVAEDLGSAPAGAVRS